MGLGLGRLFLDRLCMSNLEGSAVMPAKSDSDVMYCLQSYQELRIDRSIAY